MADDIYQAVINSVGQQIRLEKEVRVVFDSIYKFIFSV